jgi:hypothetical protein
MAHGLPLSATRRARQQRASVEEFAEKLGLGRCRDFFGNGTDDILFHNNGTGDTWFEAISNGSAGWNHIGGSSTSFTVKT